MTPVLEIYNLASLLILKVEDTNVIFISEVNAIPFTSREFCS